MDVVKKIEADGGTSANNGSDIAVVHKILKVTIQESDKPDGDRMPARRRLGREAPEFDSAAADVHRPGQALHGRDGHQQGHDDASPSTRIAAPKTVNNFVVLARYHYYDGIVFHRIIPGFVLQGGDPQGDGRGGPGYRFEDELPPAGRYEVGSLAMANAGPDTNGSQFFVISGPDGVRLPPQYSLFGKVVKGLDVVADIESVGTPSGHAHGEGHHQVGDDHRG